MDILYFLKEKFAELKELMGVSVESEVGTRDELLRKSRRLNTLQREYLYPEISGLSTSLDQIVDQSLKNLAKIDASLAEAVSQKKQGNLSGLVLALKEHMFFDEAHLMPKLRTVMRTEDREDLGQVLADAEEELMSGNIEDQARAKESQAGVGAGRSRQGATKMTGHAIES